MCGITGYIGSREADEIILEGLKKLEYRGYDSAGIAVLNQAKVSSCKTVGKIANLERELIKIKLDGKLGIGHTRWATHGAPSQINAHPHTDCTDKIWLVHNGIIENYQILKKELLGKGHVFKSQTDTEVIAHLIEDFYAGDLLEAVMDARARLIGAYALVIFHSHEPDSIIATRKSSPLIIGFNQNEKIIASDEKAIASHTKEIIYLDDGEVAYLTRNSFKVITDANHVIKKDRQRITWDLAKLDKGEHQHYMLKEILEQPEAVTNSVRGRINLKEKRVVLGGLEKITKKIKRIDQAVVIACGTAYYAGTIGSYLIEKYARISARAELASEFRYRNPVINDKTLVIAISQSGETADTLAAVEEAKRQGAPTIGIINNVGSIIARTVDAGIYNHIGPEIAVASTKAFVSQLALLILLSLNLTEKQGKSIKERKEILDEMQRLPNKIRAIIKGKEEIKKIAERYCAARDFGFIGRKYNYPIALEGALKLKEISYIHAEGFPSGELKHGSIALIDEHFPTIVIAPKDSVYDKNISNTEEIKARKGKIIAIATKGDEAIKSLADEVIYIPQTLEILTPILTVIPLQLFSYYAAFYRGCDIDQPRNLAKSVTVE